MDRALANLSFINHLKKSIPRDVVQPRRSQVYVGFKCHQRCGFCYYRNHCYDEMFSLDFVKKQIDFLIEYGIEDFEITGGEPSEFDSLRNVCQYIKSKSSQSKIAVITNGSLWKSDCWDLIDEVLLSYHLGRDSTGYDKQMFPLGYTFEKAFKTQEKAHNLGKLLRTNTVVGTFNLECLGQTIEDVVSFNPAIVNFLPVNLFDEAKTMTSFIDYSKLRPSLKKAIDYIRINLPESLVFVRYMPFCQMEGYEKHIIGHVQHIYDWFDWNVELSGIEWLDEIKKDDGKSLLKRLGRYGSTSLESSLAARKQLYSKPCKCIKCKYNLICDGIENGIPDKKVEEFSIPISGPIVGNPLEYAGHSAYDLYQKVYGKDKINKCFC